MRRDKQCCIGIGVLLACLVAGVGQADESFDETLTRVFRSSSPATEPAAPPPGPPSVAAEKANLLVEYFLEQYSAGLTRPDWVARSLAVISLAAIDDPRVTAKLLEVARTNTQPLTRVYAFEALHARNDRLTDEQRKEFVALAKEMLRLKLLRGQLRVAGVRLLRGDGPSAENQQRFLEVFAATNSMDPADIPTILALRDTLGAWRSPDLARALIGCLGTLDDAWRAEMVLAGLGAPVPPSSTLVAKGSRDMWNETQAAWGAWFNGAALAARTDGAAPYTGCSRLIGPPEKITNPQDPRWRRNLELPPLHLDQLDVSFAVDSTGSMTDVVKWIQRDVMKMMRAFGMISREPRIGVTFYRDHGDEYVVKMTPLTGNAAELAKAISRIEAKGGGDVPEAVLEALQTVITGQRWTPSNEAKKIIVLVGDAEPHPESTDAIRQLLEKSAEKGFRVFCVKARTRYGSSDLAIFDEISRWGKGTSLEMTFSDRATYEARPTGVALPREGESPYALLVREVFTLILTEAYQDRTEPFVNVLMEYLDEPVKEDRKSFPAAPPPRTPPREPTSRPHQGGERRPDDPKPPPYDPQAR